MSNETYILKVEVTGEFLLRISFFAYIEGLETALALLLAALCHEYGHLLMIALQGKKLYAVKMEGLGFCLEAEPADTTAEQLLRCLAGPLCGAVLWLMFRTGEDGLLCCCAGYSRMLTLFNLLPAACLDGGCAVRTVLASACPQWEKRLLRLLTAFSLLLCLWSSRKQPQLLLWAVTVALTALKNRNGES